MVGLININGQVSYYTFSVYLLLVFIFFFLAMYYAISEPNPPAPGDVGRYLFDQNDVITWHGLGLLQVS
jgi:hypothetical protein